MNIIELPISIIDNIVSYINDTDSIYNLRLSCKSLYFILYPSKYLFNLMASNFGNIFFKIF